MSISILEKLTNKKILKRYTSNVLLTTAITLSGCQGETSFMPSILDTMEIACYETRPVEDRDCDWVLRNEDNCPNDYNPYQTDSNHNGLGDACENSTPISLSPENRYDACYYLSQSDVDEVTSLFSTIASNFTKDFWIEGNGHPCDNPTNISTPIPQSDCRRCMDSIFSYVGW